MWDFKNTLAKANKKKTSLSVCRCVFFHSDGGGYQTTNM